MAVHHDEIIDENGKVKEKVHVEHHHWIHKKRTKEQDRCEMLNKVKANLLSALVISTVMSFFALLWWAFVTFIKAGGNV